MLVLMFMINVCRRVVMKPKQFLIPFLLISFILILSASGQLNSESQPKFHVTQMEMRFDGLNATATIDYDLGFLTEMYVFLFGNHNLVPYVEDFLYDFKEFQITSVSGTKAAVELPNSARVGGSSYIHDGREIGSTVPTLIMVYAYPGTEIETRVFEDVNKTRTSIIAMNNTDVNLTQTLFYDVD